MGISKGVIISKYREMTQNDPQPVVLIHGLMRTFLSMSYLGKQLGKEGYKPINYSYKSRHHSIAEQADKLNEFLVKQGLTSSNIHFVTHSLGSIVLRQFALTYSENYRLGRAVMLGPPNQGSGLALLLEKHIAIGKILGPSFRELTCLQLEPASDKIEIGVIAGATGRKRGLPPYGIKDGDGIVALEETRLEGMKDHLSIPFVHSLLMYHPEVIRQTIHFLKKGVFEH